MAVDLSTGKEGIITFKNGDTYFCVSINGKDDRFVVRIESGEYWPFKKDGRYADSLIFEGSTDARVIIDFIPCKFDDPRARGLKTQVCP